MIQRWKVGCGMFPDKDHGDYILYSDYLGEIERLAEENEAFRNTTRFRNLEEENAKLKLERIVLLEEMSALLEDRPLPNGEYIHVLTCNASRLEPVGNEMCSCPIGRRIKRRDR